MLLDRYTILAVSALISVVLGLVLLAAQAKGRLGAWVLCWGLGTVAMGLAGADQAAKGLLPDAWLVSAGNMLAISGYALVVQGARLLTGRKARWGAFAAVLAMVLLPLLLSNGPEDRTLRVAYNNAILILCDLWVVFEGVRLVRSERLSTAWIMVALFALPVPFSILRLGVAASTLLGAASLDQAKVNTWLAALLAALWSLRGALPALLIAERSTRQLARLAHHDMLTGALNRAGLERLKRTLDGPVAVVAMDLDHFKALNDRHGHARGDLALRTLAQVADEHCKGRGAFVRMGGDEFVLVLPGAVASEAERLPESIRVGFGAAMRTLGIGDPLPTLSIGIACGAAGIESLLMEADRTLYLSKAAGRDRIAIAA